MSTPNNNITLVTGSSRGLGRDMALQLADQGHKLIVTYHSNKEAAEEVAAEVERRGQKAITAQIDTRDTESFPKFFEQLAPKLKSAFGTDKIDFLVNNAGTTYHGMVADTTEKAFDDLYHIHFKGVYFLTQAALPHLNDGGGIVNVSTGLTRFAIPGYSAYASMKGAIEVYTQYLAKELGGRGIRANAVAPGAIDTDFNAAAFEHNPGMKEQLASVTSLGRVGKASDIGGVVAFLCSPAGAWVNAQRLEASGGMFL